MHLPIIAPVLLQAQMLLLRQAASALKATSPSHGHLGRIGSLTQTDPSAFDSLIAEACRRYDVDPALVKGLIKAESGFDPLAESSAGAKGLMQLLDGTADALGVDDVFDPAQNIEGGVRFLRQLLDRFQDEGLALAAYNAGAGAVERYGSVPPFAETQTYVPRVLSYRDEFSTPQSWEA